MHIDNEKAVKWLDRLRDGVANSNSDAERVVALAMKAGAWRRLALELMPHKPADDPSDGPCCHELKETPDGKMRWIGTSCHCANYDDAQRAAVWADDMNRWLDAMDFVHDEGLDVSILEEPS